MTSSCICHCSVSWNDLKEMTFQEQQAQLTPLVSNTILQWKRSRLFRETTDYRLRQEIHKMGQEHPVVHGSAKKKKKAEGILKGYKSNWKSSQ